MAERICDECDRDIKNGEPDPCIGGYIPGVAHACCGHGNVHAAYCVGWVDCKPNEKIGGVSKVLVDELNNIVGIVPTNKLPGFWEKRGKDALDYMKRLPST